MLVFQAYLYLLLLKITLTPWLNHPLKLFLELAPKKLKEGPTYSKRQKVSSYRYTKLMHRGEIFDFKAVAKVLGQSMQSFIQRMENSEIRGHF